MEKNVITFIIPSINRESLSKCIDSLINQTTIELKLLELIKLVVKVILTECPD